MGIYDTIKSWDPTKVPKADTSGVQAAEQGLKEKAGRFEAMGERYQQRDAPRVMAPQDMRRANVQNVQTGNLLTSGFDPSVAATQVGGPTMSPYEQQALDLYSGAATGQAPSAAENMLRAGMERNARQASALAAQRGYDPAAMRGAQYQMAQAGQEAALEAGQLRAQEMEAARAGLLGGAQAQRAAEQQMAQYQAQLEQEANFFSKTEQGRMQLAQAEIDLKAQLANQGIDLEILKQNAARGDAFALAQLEAQLKQQGLNDAMTLGYIQAATGMETAVIQSQLSQAKMEQERQAASAQARTGIIGGALGALGSIFS